MTQIDRTKGVNSNQKIKKLNPIPQPNGASPASVNPVIVATSTVDVANVAMTRQQLYP